MVQSSVTFFDGLIAEYRENDRLLGVMTGTVDGEAHPTGLVLQHVMVWPGVPAGTLLRMLMQAEQAAWLRAEYIILDVEHTHPHATLLHALAERRGFREYAKSEKTTWYIKRRPE